MFKNALILTVFCLYGALAYDIDIGVYYSALCGDSVRFFANHFYPTYQQHGSHINTELVPFGKAKFDNSTGTITFTCQFGDAECYGGKVHSCALDLYNVTTSTEFIVCAMASGNASSEANLEKCATDNGITWSTLEECVTSGRGNELFYQNGLRTLAIVPNLTFVPTIVYNDQFSDPLHNLGYQHFQHVLDFFIEQIDCGHCLWNGASRLFNTGLFTTILMVSLGLQKVLA